MNKQTSSAARQLPFDYHPPTHYPILKWANNTQQRFSAKLYTYTPKSSQNSKKRSTASQFILDPEGIPNNKIYGSDPSSNEAEKHHCPSKLLDSVELEQENRIQTQEGHKCVENQMIKVCNDAKEQYPLKMEEAPESIFRKTCAKEKSQSSEWTSERKSSRRKKAVKKSVRKVRAEAKSKRDKKGKRQEKTKVAQINQGC